MVVDLETTGGSSQTEAITEIGAVKVRGGEVLGEFATLVDPGRVDPAADHHAHRHHRLDGVRRPDGSTPCCRRSWSSSAARCWSRTTPPFDVGFLKAACARLELPWPGPAVVDTVRLARRVLDQGRGAERPAVRTGPAAGRDGGAGPSGAAPTPGPPSTSCTRCSNGSASLGVHSLSELQDASRDVSPERRRKRRLADHLPAAPGVYLFRGPSDEVLYVGTSGNLHQRVRSYFSAAETRDRIKQMVTLAERVDHVECAHALEAHVREQRLIAVHQPPYNRRSRATGQDLLGHADRRGVPAARASCEPRPIGPAPASGRSRSRLAAQTAVEALQDAVPIRRCTQPDPPHRSGRQSLRAGRTRPVRRAVLRRGGRAVATPGTSTGSGTDRRPSRTRSCGRCGSG